VQEALAAAGNYSIEMSKPVAAAETTEEPTAKSCRYYKKINKTKTVTNIL
jgi:hypothetical protein